MGLRDASDAETIGGGAEEALAVSAVVEAGAVEEEVVVLGVSEVVVGSVAVEQGGAGNYGDHDTRRSR